MKETTRDARQILEELDQLERQSKKLAAAHDRCLFATIVGLQPHPWQQKVLQSNRARILLNCCRQAGKSTAAAVLALHQALYVPGSLILILAGVHRQSAETFDKVQAFLSRLEPRPDLRGDSRTEVRFANGSRIVSLPGDEEKIRGFSAPALVILDEAGDVQDDLYHAVLPMLITSRGRLLIMGTPRGQRGFFYNEWKFGGNRWARHEVPWTEVPSHQANQDEVLAQKVALGEKFGQEYECQFMSLAGGMMYPTFSRPINVIPALPESTNWKHMLAIDFGFVDSTGFVVLGWRPNDPVLYIPYSMQKSGLVSDDIAKVVRELSGQYKFSRIIGDVGGYGKGPAMELTSRYGLHIEPAPKQEKAGYIDILNGAFAAGKVQIVEASNPELIHQIETLAWNDSRTNQRDGQVDHLADGLIYGFRVASAYLQVPVPKDDRSPAERIRQETRDYWAQKEQETHAYVPDEFDG